MTALLTHIYRSLSVPYIDNEVKKRGKKKEKKKKTIVIVTRSQSAPHPGEALAIIIQLGADTVYF